MFKWIGRIISDWWNGFRDWVNTLDDCELCHEEQADETCVGCKRRICMLCDSGYYADAELCKDCRKEIPPEEEEQDNRDAANTLLEQCTCSSGASCDLSKEDHEFIAKYAGKETG